MNGFATSDVLSVSESGYLGVLLLHGQHFIHTCLAVLHTILQLLQIHFLLLPPDAFVLQTISLTVQNVSHGRILRQGPVCQFKLESTDEVLCLESLDLFCHVCFLKLTFY